jgi:hypothetical protein
LLLLLLLLLAPKYAALTLALAAVAHTGNVMVVAGKHKRRLAQVHRAHIAKRTFDETSTLVTTAIIAAVFKET